MKRIVIYQVGCMVVALVAAYYHRGSDVSTWIAASIVIAALGHK